uniref:Choline transporter-like protein 5 n=1 Tax=Lygus hesperus TaxID=30085 RepID=A0A0A9XYH5_LYGHE
MKTLVFLVLLLLCYSAVVTGQVDNDETEDAAGRGLVFWNGGTIKFIVGWSIPLPIHLPFVTLFIHTLQMAYPTISNATQISQLLQQGLAKGVRYTKRSVYYLIDRLFSSYGNLNRQCLVRFICELSQMSIGHSLAGELMQYIFKPDDGTKYSKAWERGSSYQECNDFYYCPYAQDMLSHFTTVQYL